MKRIALVLLLVGCGEPLTEGVVVRKYYDDPDTWLQLLPAGKVVVPITHHDPERWVVVLSGVTPGGKEREQEFAVARQVYDSLGIGVRFVVDHP